MKTRFLLSFIVFSFLFCSALSARTFVVSPDGVSTDGMTLERAVASVPILSDRGVDVEIVLKGGIYTIEKPIEFGKMQGAMLEFEPGKYASRVIVRAEEGEKVLITGGKVLKNFVPWKNGIFKTNVREQGLDGVDFKVLVADGERQRMARWPNFDPENPYSGGWAYADGEYIPMYQTIEGEPKNQFHYKPEDAREWRRPEELRVMVFPRYNWWNNQVPVKSIDRDARLITLTANCSYPIRPNDRYYIENALEELDAPGEWYLDREDGTLYFYPPKNPVTGRDRTLEEMNQMTVTAQVASCLFTLTETQGIEFRGLTLENATREAAVVKNCADVVFTDCVIRNVGSYSSTAIYFQNCTRCGVKRSEISFIGGTAIGLNGGDKVTLTPGENFVEDCVIHHTGIDFKQGVGVSMSGVGNRVSHCEIHDCPRFGIGFGGQNQIIEFNHIHHVNLETCDTGAIYTGGRNWISSYGTQVRYNYFHDVLGFGWNAQEKKWESPHYCWGIYLDDNTGGVDVYGNVVVGCIRGLIHLHNGRDNHIWNNIFVDGTLNQFEANGWTVDSKPWKDHFPTMVTGYESIADAPAWNAMRHHGQHPKDAPLPDGSIMQGNKLWNNIFYFSNPNANCFGTRWFNPKFNESDRNLIWNYAEPEAVIHATAAGYEGESLTVAEIPVTDPGFESGEAGKFPTQCRWQSNPSGKAVVVLDDTVAHRGKQSLRIEADFNPANANNTVPALVFPGIQLKEGSSYRVSAWYRAAAENGSARIGVHYYRPGAYWGAGSASPVGTEWKKISHVVHVPKKGESGWKEGMDSFNISISNPSRDGVTLWVDDVQLEEVTPNTTLKFWQSLGFDRNSVVADPLFEDAKNGDYRLKKDSPAWKLGFQPIPLDEIGPRK